MTLLNKFSNINYSILVQYLYFQILYAVDVKGYINATTQLFYHTLITLSIF